MAGLVEYLVLTKCGRRFAWSAPSLDTLFRDMQARNYVVTYITTMEEFNAMSDVEKVEVELRYAA